MRKRVLVYNILDYLLNYIKLYYVIKQLRAQSNEFRHGKNKKRKKSYIGQQQERRV